MQHKRIFVLLGHPDKETLNGHIADTYEAEALAAGHEVRRLNIGELSFDPILHKGYKVIQELEPDLKIVQEHMRWADHFVLIYPLWWSSMPALLKGVWDRMCLPGFGFRFHKGKPGWEKLLKGRTARVVVTSKSPPFAIWLMFGDFTNEIARATLGFIGYRVAITTIGNAEGLSEKALAGIEKKIMRLARRGV